jgi:hypothetical protein
MDSLECTQLLISLIRYRIALMIRAQGMYETLPRSFHVKRAEIGTNNKRKGIICAAELFKGSNTLSFGPN